MSYYYGLIRSGCRFAIRRRKKKEEEGRRRKKKEEEGRRRKEEGIRRIIHIVFYILHVNPFNST
jgi:hypothetical protein